MKGSIFALLFFLLFSGGALGADEAWPQFLGPKGSGISPAKGVPIEFGESKNLDWKTELPGRGWSSPVYDGTHLWLTTALEKNAEVAEGQKGTPEVSAITLMLLKVAPDSGELLQEIFLGEVVDPQDIHKQNSFASPTPIIEGGVIYAHFGAFGTFAVDTATSEILWQQALKIDHKAGPGSSPFLCKDLLILICDGTDLQYVAALDKRTGEIAWKTDRPAMRTTDPDRMKAYSTPVFITDREGREQLICLGAQWMVSYVPETGEEIWRLDHGDGFSVVPRPVFSERHQLLYFSSGFTKPSLYAVEVDGSGDITAQDKIRWTETKRIPARPSPLLIGEELYVISDGGIASCMDALTGNGHWIDRPGGNFSASPLYADGHLYFSNHEGEIIVIPAGKTYTVAAKNQLDGSIRATPITIDRSLIIRSDTALYRFTKS